MKINKGTILSILLCILFSIILAMNFTNQSSEETPSSVYQVYLDGEKVGLISDKSELYTLINEEQVEIKDEYNVDQVYPPKGFQIIKKQTYDEELSTVEEVYNSIKEEKQFTIKGYTITIKSSTENVEPTYIYVLDKSIFEEALTNVIESFIGEERYEQYLNDTQPEIVDTGYSIDKIYFKDTITIKESYVSVDEKIYTDVDSLTKYLLFGNNASNKEYTVVQGDTVESIANANKLNTSELLIANDDLKSEDTLLAIGQKINVALIDPILTLVYEETVVEDEAQQYQTVYKETSSLYKGETKTQQKGINGVNRITSSVQFINGEQNQQAIILDSKVIKSSQDEIILKGTKVVSGSTGHYVDNGEKWAWPTNSPYVITSPYAYRWGTLHDGIDISGTGLGSPIYAALDGVVVQARYGGIVGSSAGYNVVIKHANGYYTVYAHMRKQPSVKAGETVKRGQKIGEMGATGTAYGVHLHFGVFDGEPYHGGKSFNPMLLWK